MHGAVLSAIRLLSLGMKTLVFCNSGQESEVDLITDLILPFRSTQQILPS
jgi:hypothetical protein